MIDQELLLCATRFRFKDYEVRECSKWWEVFDIIKCAYVKSPYQSFRNELDSVCEYNFTREEAINYAQELASKEK